MATFGGDGLSLKEIVVKAVTLGAQSSYGEGVNYADLSGVDCPSGEVWKVVVRDFSVGAYSYTYGLSSLTNSTRFRLLLKNGTDISFHSDIGYSKMALNTTTGIIADNTSATATYSETGTAGSNETSFWLHNDDKFQAVYDNNAGGSDNNTAEFSYDLLIFKYYSV